MHLSEEEKESIAELLKPEGVVEASVFGSYARGDADEESDVDIVVEFDEPKSLVEVARIQREISEVVGTEVDLVTRKSLSPHIKDRISSEEVLIA